MATTKTAKSTKKASVTPKKEKPIAKLTGKLSKALRPGQTVKVLVGRDRDKTGKIVKVDRKHNRVIIEGVNAVLDNNKARQVEGQTGRVEKNLPVNISNVKIINN